MRVLGSALDDVDKELLENNRQERNHIEDEIRELRERNVSIALQADAAWLLLLQSAADYRRDGLTTQPRQTRQMLDLTPPNPTQSNPIQPTKTCPSLG